MSDTRRTEKRRPRGREEICSALIASALDQIEAHGLDITIRQIARHADVPHSLVGRYFGSKDGLIRAAIDSTLPADQELADGFDDPETAAMALFDTTFDRPDRFRLLVQLLQSGMAPREVRSDAPVLRGLIRTLETARPDHGDPRTIAAAVMALSAGWLLIEDYVVDHAELVGDVEKVRHEVRDLMLRML